MHVQENSSWLDKPEERWKQGFERNWVIYSDRVILLQPLHCKISFYYDDKVKQSSCLGNPSLQGEKSCVGSIQPPQPPPDIDVSRYLYNVTSLCQNITLVGHVQKCHWRGASELEEKGHAMGVRMGWHDNADKKKVLMLTFNHFWGERFLCFSVDGQESVFSIFPNMLNYPF